MRRVHPAVLLLLLLTACARPSADVNTDSAQVLEGIPSEYSVRLSDLPTSERLGQDSTMRHALIAGDPTLYVAATLYRCGDYLAMDLIVLNQEREVVEIKRTDVHVVNGDGRWLTPVEDFEGAADVGLRARLCPAQPNVLYESPEPSVGELSLLDPARGARPVKLSAPSSSLSSRTRTSVPAWRDGQGGYGQAPNAPEILSVGPDEGKAFWAYWEANELRTPLTAVVMLEDEQLLFRFRP